MNGRVVQFEILLGVGGVWRCKNPCLVSHW